MKRHTGHFGEKAYAGLILFSLLSAGCFDNKQSGGNESEAVVEQQAEEDGGLREVDTEGRGHLYREEVEIYWNDWRAVPVSDFEPSVRSDEIRIEIVGEGKTADFIGVLAINRMDDKVFWITGSHFGDELVSNDIDRFVPFEVKIRARERFARRK